jgi:hypothetical protein
VATMRKRGAGDRILNDRRSGSSKSAHCPVSGGSACHGHDPDERRRPPIVSSPPVAADRHRSRPESVASPFNSVATRASTRSAARLST